MKVAFVTSNLPHRQGTAAGRQLAAIGDALLAAGHQISAWCWSQPPDGLTPPDWCQVRPVPAPPAGALRDRAQTLLHPRDHLRGCGWLPPAGAVAFADDWDSVSALAGAAAAGVPTALVVHYSVRLDTRATRDLRPGALQEWRAQRRAVRRVAASAALSERVRRELHAQRVVPFALPVPAAPLPLVEAPVALLLANWTWRPNRVALQRLLDAWRRVRDHVPRATLLIAGRGLAEPPSGEGIRVLGEVRDTADAMAQAAVLAFPCPPSTGPKAKVLDAALHGLPVVTTPGGAEGLERVDGLTVAGGRFADALSRVLLMDTGRRAGLADRARSSAVAHHGPDVAARAWLELAAAAG